MTFTAHNVLLNDGTQTIPEQRVLLEETPNFQAAVRSLRNSFGPNLTGLRVVDLGCLEGGYTAGFARLGMIAKGIEVRQSNLDCCEIVRQGVNLPNLSFNKDNVLNLESYGSFDAVFCSGLLYHLDNPRAFVDIMSRASAKVIILHTHYATHEPSRHPKLSEMDTNEGMSGRWYSEHEETDDDAKEKLKWASWDNHRSFWNTKGGLFDMLRCNGFSLVYEQMDWLNGKLEESMTEGGQYYRNQRTMIVGVRM